MAGHEGFADKVLQVKCELLGFLLDAAGEGRSVVGYGAPGKGNTLLNHCGIRADLLSYTVDRNPLQAGTVPPRDAYPHLCTRAHRRDPARLCSRPALEPQGRDQQTARLRQVMGRSTGLPDSRAGNSMNGGLTVKVVLFCGGFGMRMRDGVSSGPKPMAMVGQRPLLWHVMRYYAHFGHTDFVLCLGYGASYVKDFFLNYDETRSNDFVLENGAATSSCSALTSPTGGSPSSTQD